MNKSDIVGRLAGRMGLTRSTAESAVDTVLGAIAEALAKEEAVRLAGFGTFRTKRCGPVRTEPGDRGKRTDRGFESTVVQGGQGTEGRREQGVGNGVRRWGG